ncbi:hypothetical protein TIFTF001_018102 [Ficus carica]|uniref:Uncharacterized protein n=1 Tax=Ficus carica TaxID=3494 RepID=A0AA88A6E2_FICCA|nr:hypothetical protein TIFTF001_018102 [Ficus carica]
MTATDPTPQTPKKRPLPDAGDELTRPPPPKAGEGLFPSHPPLTRSVSRPLTPPP